MPRELRNIYFDESELKIALMQFSARQKLIFNVENINDVDVKEGPPISVSLKVFDLETGKVGTVNYSNPEIAAALMGYCMF
ncbi:MAG: hypothetical protein HOH19_02435, partial [Kordiimonadaceae bacterium]|nr:hypothetical protein [Kordiimonadaceae bacterium]